MADISDNEKSAVTDFACNYQPMVQKNLYKTSYSIPGEVKNHYRNKTLSGVRSLVLGYFLDGQIRFRNLLRF